MLGNEIRYTQVVPTEFAVEKLADGTTAVLDRRSMSVHSLNASATVVWEACKQGATLAQVRQALEIQSGKPVDDEIAISALSQLKSVNLITPNSPVPGPIIDSARRSALRRLAAAAGIAVPLVLTLTASEQRALAFQANSQAKG